MPLAKIDAGGLIPVANLLRKERKILELCLLVGEEFRSELLVEEIDCCVSSMLASEQLRQYVGVGH